MFRATFLYLSRQKWLRRLLENSAPARKLSSRFVAGGSLEQAVAVAQRVNREGLSITLDYLGEHVASLEDAAVSRDMYVKAVQAIGDSGVNANVSLKLTQFGIDVSEPGCAELVASVVETAHRHNSFVRIDMENTPYTDVTIALTEELHAAHGGSCGTVIQSYLRRSEADIRRLNARGIRVRLVKGAYLEPPALAFQKKREVDAEFIRLAKLLLEEGNYPAIATHDEKIIKTVIEFAKAKSIAPDAFEFQMLYGIRRDLQRRLVADGWRMRLYVPFGQAWAPYFMRRLAERPANVLFLARNFFRG